MKVSSWPLRPRQLTRRTHRNGRKHVASLLSRGSLSATIADRTSRSSVLFARHDPKRTESSSTESRTAFSSSTRPLHAQLDRVGQTIAPFVGHRQAEASWKTTSILDWSCWISLLLRIWKPVHAASGRERAPSSSSRAILSERIGAEVKAPRLLGGTISQPLQRWSSKRA